MEWEKVSNKILAALCVALLSFAHSIGSCVSLCGGSSDPGWAQCSKIAAT